MRAKRINHQGLHRRTQNKYRTCIIIILINYQQVRRGNLLILFIKIHLTN